jgi:hypothetical protein
MSVVMHPIDSSSGAPVYTAQQIRQVKSVLYTPGAAGRPLGARSGVRGGTSSTTVALSGTGSTTWTVLAHSGLLDTETPVAAGAYEYACDGTDTGTLTPADSTNNRIDVIWVAPDDTVQDGSGLRNGVIGYTAGNPLTPTVPATPSNPRAMVLAQVLVPKATTGSPSVTWVAPYTVASGGILPVKDATDLATVPGYPGQYIDRGDAHYLVRFNGTVWETIARAGGPLGYVADGVKGAGSTDCVAAWTDVMSLTVPVVLNRRYRVTAYASGQQVTSGPSTSRTQVIDDQGDLGLIAYQTALPVNTILLGTGVMYMTANSTRNAVFKVQGAASVSALRVAAASAWILVEDMGT